MRNVFFAAAAVLAISATAASAADLPARTYTKAPIAAPLPTWNGLYVGVFGGYGWSDSFRLDVLFGTVPTGNDLKGGFGGGTIGYNWQAAGSSFVFGVEVDAAGADIKYTLGAGGGAGLTDKINAFGTVTGRVGYTLGSALLYAKGGYAWSDNKLTIGGIGGSLSESNWTSGYTVGAGVEYAFAPAWSAKVEYLYADFEKQNYFSSQIPGGFNLSTSIHTIKGGLNYHLNWF